MHGTGSIDETAWARLAAELARLDGALSPAALCGSARSIRRLASLCGLPAAVQLAERLEAAAASPCASRLYRERLRDAVDGGACSDAESQALLASVAIRLG